MPPRAAADWAQVLTVARAILDEHGPMPRPDLWRALLDRGEVPPSGADGFRAAVWAAQRKDEFPALPKGRTGPAKGVEWTDDRHAAEQVRKDEPTPVELYTERMTECLNILRSLAGVRAVRLSPSVLAILAAKGWGEHIVRQAVAVLVDSGLAELRYEVQGIHAVPVVQAA